MTATQAQRSYWITTFGCQMNKADSERMAGILESMGYVPGTDEHSADLVLYNTCTIRDNAEQKVYSYLGRQAQRKRTNPNLTLVVAGCVAQQEGASLLRRCCQLAPADLAVCVFSSCSLANTTNFFSRQSGWGQR